MIDASLLRAGDVLLYRGTGFFSWLIRTKTWSEYSHCEVYDGAWWLPTGRTGALVPHSVASRDGKGVGRYPLRTDGLAVVLRPKGAFDIKAAHQWFRTVDGQQYDWLGLAAFIGTRWQGTVSKRQFCSEFATRYLRAGGFDPFNGYDADGIAPGEFAKCPMLDVLWSVDALDEAA